MTKRSLRRSLLAVFAVSVIATALAGCGLKEGGGATASAAGKTDLTIGIGQLAPSVDIDVDVAYTSRNSLDFVYDRLVNPDYVGGWKPNVATKWAFNADVTELTFTLRDDVTFTNGEKLDAAAVKYSLDRILDPANKAQQIGTVAGKFAGATVIDATHVSFQVKNHDATAMSALSMIYLVPPKYAAEKGMGMGGEAVGSGPMKVESFTPNDHLKLVPNPTYWGKKVTNVTSMTWLSIPDEAARTAALQSGRADIVLPLSPDIWEGLKKSTTATAYAAAVGQYQTLFLGKYTMDTPLKDVRVRQAVALAIDTKLITSSILRGTTAPASQFVEKESDAYNPDVKPYAYDPAKAKQLLDEAGYPNGFTIAMESTIGRTPGDKEVAGAIVDMLAKVGITVNWTPLPPSEWLTKFVTGTGAPLFLLNASVEASMMPENPLQQWTSHGFTKVFSDPSYDAIVAKMISTADQGERNKLIQDASAYLHEAAPIDLLYKVPMLYGLSKKVHGFQVNPDLSFDPRALSIAG